jgi:outer membrane protein
MKKILATSMALFLLAGVSFAQKFAFVDTDYILQNIPSYNAAQEELNKASEEWETEIAAEYEQIQTLYKTYQSERVLLTDEMKQKREEEIMTKEREVKELQAKYFGPEGDLSKKIERKPLQGNPLTFFNKSKIVFVKNIMYVCRRFFAINQFNRKIFHNENHEKNHPDTGYPLYCPGITCTTIWTHHF